MATTDAAAGKDSTDTSAATTTTDDKKTTAEGTPTPEQKAAADKAAADKKTTDDAAAAAAKKDKAPEKYTLKVPDEAKDWLDDNDLKTIEGIARAKGWTQDEAQGAVTEHAEALAKQSATFRAEIEADKTYGGDHLAETQRLATLALDKIRPATTEQGKALRGMLAKTGYGNNLLVVSLLADIGKMMDEDSTHLTAGAQRGAKGKDHAETLYGPEKK